MSLSFRKRRKPLTPRYPVKRWLFDYYKWYRVMHTKGGLRFQEDLTRTFFDHHEPFKGLEEFTMAHAIDYFKWRVENGGKGRAILEMKALRAFWQWLIIDKDLPLVSPFRAAAFKYINEFNPVKAELPSSLEAEVEVTPTDKGSPVPVQDVELLMRIGIY